MKDQHAVMLNELIRKEPAAAKLLLEEAAKFPGDVKYLWLSDALSVIFGVRKEMPSHWGK